MTTVAKATFGPEFPIPKGCFMGEQMLRESIAENYHCQCGKDCPAFLCLRLQTCMWELGLSPVSSWLSGWP
jgi:hypothetical protein